MKKNSPYDIVKHLMMTEKSALLKEQNQYAFRVAVDATKLEVAAAEGQALDIGFNITYLLDVLNHLDSEQIDWHFNDNNSSILVTAPDNQNFKYVVMPMRI